MDVTIRTAQSADLPFLREMLYEAAFWRPGQTRPPIDVALADPELAKLLADWGRGGDSGLIAMNQDGKPIGAAWFRFWSDDNHSYGFVDASIPEIAIGVVDPQRGRGIGKALLEALTDHSRSMAVQKLSLSVERDNPALRLYKRIGFKIVGSADNAWTMVVDTGPR